MKQKRKQALSKRYTEDYRWNIAFEAMEELTGANVKAIRKASKVPPLPASRMIMTYTMYHDLYLNKEYISNQLNKDQALVYYYLQVMEEEVKKSPFKDYYQEFKRLLFHKLESLGYRCVHCGALEAINHKDLYTKPKRNVSKSESAD